MEEIKKQRLPTVSVVVPNLNQGLFLEQAIESILSQPGIDIRIAVMDAGSQDNSLTVIKKYESKLKFWRSGPDGGQASAINEGMQKLPPSDYVCWLNADDTFFETGLAEMVQFLEEHPENAAVYAKAYITDENNEIVRPYCTEPFSAERLAYHCFICQPATLIRYEAWNQVKGLDSSFHMCLDYDFWWRLSKIGSIGYLEEFSACSRDHEGTKTNNNQHTHFKEAFLLLKNHYGHVPLNWCLAYTELYVKAPKVLLKTYQKIAGLILYFKYRY